MSDLTVEEIIDSVEDMPEAVAYMVQEMGMSVEEAYDCYNYNPNDAMYDNPMCEDYSYPEYADY